MANERVENLIIENARIIFKNFEGRKTDYNDEGDRNFNLVISDEAEALALKEIGWNVKERTNRNDELEWIIQVDVSFKRVQGLRPMKVMQVTKKNQIPLNEETIGNLDYAEIRNIDMTVRGYEWGPIQGKYGIKAYLQEMWVTIEEDDWADKYAMEETNQEPMPFD